MRIGTHGSWLGLSFLFLGGCASSTSTFSQGQASSASLAEASQQVPFPEQAWGEASLEGFTVHLKAERACLPKEGPQREIREQIDTEGYSDYVEVPAFERCHNPSPYPQLDVILVSVVITPTGPYQVRIKWGKTDSRGEFTETLSNLDSNDLGYPYPFRLHLEFEDAEQTLLHQVPLDTTEFMHFLGFEGDLEDPFLGDDPLLDEDQFLEDSFDSEE